MPERIVVVEDDDGLRDLLTEVLRDGGYEPHPFSSATAAASWFERGGIADLVVTDLRLPGMSGEELLGLVRRRSSEVNVIVITAFGSLDSAIELIRAGAYDYVPKPFANDELLLAVERALHESQFRRELARWARSPAGELIAGFVGASKPVQDIVALVTRAGRSRHPVLISGESGTGKELIAHAIHDISGRGPFVAVDCGALPDPLLESEVFGHERGAFTGADRAKPGLLEEAHTGTVFLDEIGELPLALQPKLLRALETGEVRRVGASAARRLDFRIVAATNRDLEEELSTGRFRRDLYWRLNVLHIAIPPLRDRPSDVPLLAEHFLTQSAGDEEGGAPTRFTPEAIALLTAYQWPGNVRELRNTVNRAAVMATGSEITAQDLPTAIREAGRAAGLIASASERRLTLRDLERAYILEVLRQVSGNKSRAAELLGMDRKTLYRKLAEMAEESGRDPA